MASTLTKKQLKKLKDMISSVPKTNVQSKRSRKGRSRKGAKLENSVIRGLATVDQYIDSLSSDVLRPGGILPSPNYFGPIRKHYVQGRTSINLANTANLHGGLVVNPRLMFLQQFQYTKVNAAAETICTIPTCYQHSLTSTSGGLPSNLLPAAGGVTAIALNGRLTNSSTGARTGWVRCTGVHFKIVYTGTWNNRGGSIVVFTNPGSIALAKQLESGAANTVPDTSFNSADEIDQAVEVTQVHCLSDEFSWTWRPSDLNFSRFDGFIPYDLANAPPPNAGNPSAECYLPSESIGASSTPMGWTTGFEIRPAAGVQGTTSNYYVDISAEYDLFETISSDTQSGVSALISSDQTVAHPMAVARVQNALSTMHSQRRSVSLMPAAKSLALNTLKMGASLAKNAAVEAMASRLAGAFS